MGTKVTRLGNRHPFNAIFPGTSQNVSYTGTAGQSAAFGATTKLVRIVASTACYVKFAADPTAVADGTSMYLAANVPEYFGVTGGHKVSAVQVASGGLINVTEATVGS